MKGNNRSLKNKADRWAGAVISWAGAVMSWAGALTSMKYSYLPFSTFKQQKNAKKSKVLQDKQSVTRPTDRQTDTVTYRSRCPRQKDEKNIEELCKRDKKS